MKMWTVPSNVGESPKVSWYRDRAEWFGQQAIARMLGNKPDEDAVMEHARLAAHFGGLVLGYIEMAGLTLVPMDIRVAKESPLEAILPNKVEDL